MSGTKYELKSLTNTLMKEVTAYGIREISLEQYRATCNGIGWFTASSNQEFYSPALMEKFRVYLDDQIEEDSYIRNTAVSQKGWYTCWNPWQKQGRSIFPT